MCAPRCAAVTFTHPAYPKADIVGRIRPQQHIVVLTTPCVWLQAVRLRAVRDIHEEHHEHIS